MHFYVIHKENAEIKAFAIILSQWNFGAHSACGGNQTYTFGSVPKVNEKSLPEAERRSRK